MNDGDSTSLVEVNFDGLVGPTHNYAGLALGNLASTSHHGMVSNPRAAALEGLRKMQLLVDMGVPQALLPPHPRPNLRWLHALGFKGKAADVLRRVQHTQPRLLAAAYSASAMWTANAATVCPSTDAQDGLVHLTPANLASLLHRHQEAWTTTKVLRAIFSDARYFVVHDPLPGAHFADEGAANHTRLQVPSRSAPGIHLFAWGRSEQRAVAEPRRYPARQTLEASQAVARLHELRAAPLFWQQEAAGIDAGAFHTDVLAVGSANVLLLHESAFVDPRARLAELAARMDGSLSVCLAQEAELPVAEAIRGYAFNSQLVELPTGRLHVVAPTEAQENAACNRFLQRAVSEVSEIDGVTFIDVRQSMANGGGPACLRLRVPLTSAELMSMRQSVLLDAAKIEQLQAWVIRHYRDRLSPEDLVDPALVEECQQAYDSLSAMLQLPSADQL